MRVAGHMAAAVHAGKFMQTTVTPVQRGAGPWCLYHTEQAIRYGLVCVMWCVLRVEWGVVAAAARAVSDAAAGRCIRLW